MTEQLQFLSAYCADPGPRRALMALLAAVHGPDLSEFDRLGFWDPEYRPYSFADGDRVVANFSVFPLPIRRAGRAVAAGGMSSVATLPADRGLFKWLLAERTPVSDRLAVCRHDGYFLHHCLANPAWRLAYLIDHDALVVSERRGPTVLC